MCGGRPATRWNFSGIDVETTNNKVTGFIRFQQGRREVRVELVNAPSASIGHVDLASARDQTSTMTTVAPRRPAQPTIDSLSELVEGASEEGNKDKLHEAVNVLLMLHG